MCLLHEMFKKTKNKRSSYPGCKPFVLAKVEHIIELLGFLKPFHKIVYFNCLQDTIKHKLKHLDTQNVNVDQINSMISKKMSYD